MLQDLGCELLETQLSGVFNAIAALLLSKQLLELRYVCGLLYAILNKVENWQEFSLLSKGTVSALQGTRCSKVCQSPQKKLKAIHTVILKLIKRACTGFVTAC